LCWEGEASTDRSDRYCVCDTATGPLGELSGGGILAIFHWSMLASVAPSVLLGRLAHSVASEEIPHRLHRRLWRAPGLSISLEESRPKSVCSMTVPEAHRQCWWYGKGVKVLGANQYRKEEIGLAVNTGRFEEDLS